MVLQLTSYSGQTVTHPNITAFDFDGETGVLRVQYIGSNDTYVMTQIKEVKTL